MIIDDVHQFFGSINNACKLIGVTRSTFYYWIKAGYIPFKKQQTIEKITNGKLTAKRKDAQKYYTEEEENHEESVYFPTFRYYDALYGMCEVDSLQFRKGKTPKITYKIIKKGIKKLSSFDTKLLMQGVNLKDSQGKILFEGDIYLTKKGEKLRFEDIVDVEKLNKIGIFKIIGNIFEGEFKHASGCRLLSDDRRGVQRERTKNNGRHKIL